VATAGFRLRALLPAVLDEGRLGGRLLDAVWRELADRVFAGTPTIILAATAPPVLGDVVAREDGPAEYLGQFQRGIAFAVCTEIRYRTTISAKQARPGFSRSPGRGSWVHDFTKVVTFVLPFSVSSTTIRPLVPAKAAKSTSSPAAIGAPFSDIANLPKLLLGEGFALQTALPSSCWWSPAVTFQMSLTGRTSRNSPRKAQFG
jgi:hypothetical protein